MQFNNENGRQGTPPRPPSPPPTGDVDEHGDALGELNVDLLARIRFWVVAGWLR